MRWARSLLVVLAVAIAQSLVAVQTAEAADVTTFTLTVTVEGQGIVTGSACPPDCGGTASASPAAATISCPPTCSATVEAGEITLTATPAEGFELSGWSDPCSGTGTCVFGLSADTHITATFTRVSALLSVTVTGKGSVEQTAPCTSDCGDTTTTSAASGIDCPGTCSERYPVGTSVTLNATPAAGAMFKRWTGACSSSSTSCTVSMTDDLAVTAAFVAAKHTVSVSVTGPGAVSGSGSSTAGGIACPGDCSNSYTHGEAITLKATPSVGAKFAGWSGACTGTVATCTISSIAGAKSATAKFVIASINVTVQGKGNVVGGGINCPSTCNVTTTSAVILTRARNSSILHFLGWSGACSGLGISCSVSPPATVTAKFLSGYPLAVTIAGEGQVKATSKNCVNPFCGTHVFDSDSPSRPYSEGSVVTLKATPSVGKVFGGWIGGGCTGTTTCQVTMNSPTSVTARFIKPTQSLTLAKRTDFGSLQWPTVYDYSIDPKPSFTQCFGHVCRLTFPANTKVTITPTPRRNYLFLGFSAGPCPAQQTPCTLTMSGQDPFVVMNFAVGVNLKVAVAGPGRVTGPGIDCPGDCEEVMPLGAATKLIAVPDPDSRIEKWSVPGSPRGCAEGPECEYRITWPNSSPIATFVSTKKILTVNIESGAGNVEAEGIDCPGDCSERYAEGTTVVIKAKPAANHVFSHFTGSSCYSSPCSLTMHQDRQLIAHFKPASTLTASITGFGAVSYATPSRGSATCRASSCVESVAMSNELKLIATADTGQSFEGWSGDCTGMNVTCVVNSLEKRSLNVEARFSSKTNAVEFSSLGNGRIEPYIPTWHWNGQPRMFVYTSTGRTQPRFVDPCGSTCILQVPVLRFIEYRAIPNAGWRFEGWSGGCESPSQTVCRFEVTSDTSIAALFVPSG